VTFERNSRYYGVRIATYTARNEDGSEREIPYLARRWPPVAPAGTLIEHRLAQGERLDHLSARYFADPTQFWRICDFNRVLRPDELTDQPGRFIRIPVPQP
jgi:hypothetical protein